MADQILTQQQLLDLLNPNGNIYPLDRVQLLRDIITSIPAIAGTPSFGSLPTDPSGLPAGALWRNGNFICVV